MKKPADIISRFFVAPTGLLSNKIVNWVKEIHDRLSAIQSLRKVAKNCY
jgi:hypothetical protein